MLNNAYFYHKLTRKYVVLFGNMFNNITLIRKNTETGDEIERMKIPIIYGPKEKYFTRLQSDPDLNREIGISLPRLSYELMDISYDPTRKQNSLLKTTAASSSTKTSSQYMGVPYNLNFEMTLYTRNIDDGTHIVEQILPYFNPDYTLTVDLIPELGFLKDIPIIMNDVKNNIEYEGNFDSVRYVMWTFTFTMKAHYYGPVSTQGIIRKIDNNIFGDSTLKPGNIIRINTNHGNNGTFKIDDVVYQGNDYSTATAYAKVVNWNVTNGKLILGAAQGSFHTNVSVKAVSTNASYNIASFDLTPIKLAHIHIEPKPNTAGPGDSYGYDTQITEWPNT